MNFAPPPTFRETISVAAHTPAALVVAPAVFQAVDARDGRPKQYSTNGLSLKCGRCVDGAAV
jgi:hypothetical protein